MLSVGMVTEVPAQQNNALACCWIKNTHKQQAKKTEKEKTRKFIPHHVSQCVRKKVHTVTPQRENATECVLVPCCWIPTSATAPKVGKDAKGGAPIDVVGGFRTSGSAC